MVFGVDEAGKGPVIGAMFVCAVSIKDESCLPDNLNDSKKLTDNQRERIYNKLMEDSKVEIASLEIPSEVIDAHENMNELLAEAHSILTHTFSGTEVTGYIDASDTSESRHKQNVLKNLNDADVHLVCEHQADEKFSVVQAASVVAKQKREEHVGKLNERTEREIGSGYPSDPNTRDFLKSYYNEHERFPSFTRLSWNTCDSIVDDSSSED